MINHGGQVGFVVSRAPHVLMTHPPIKPPRSVDWKVVKSAIATVEKVTPKTDEEVNKLFDKIDDSGNK